MYYRNSLKPVNRAPIVQAQQQSFVSNGTIPMVNGCSMQGAPTPLAQGGGGIPSYGVGGGVSQSIARTGSQIQAARTNVTVSIDFSEATDDANLLMFDGNRVFESFILASQFGGAGKPNNAGTAGYAAIGAVISGTYGSNTLEILRARSGNTPFVITNIHASAFTGGAVGTPATAPDNGYFDGNSINFAQATFQGNSHENSIIWPKTQMSTFTANVREFCDWRTLIYGETALIVPMKAGNRLVLSFDVAEVTDSWLMSQAKQSGCQI